MKLRLSPLLRPLALLVCLMAAGLPLGAPSPAQAVEPGEMLADPVLEARARDLSTGLRCLVCRNQSIDDSNAELARDLRILLRERLTAGDTDEQAVAYLVDRYGNFILLKPPFSAATAVLWGGPLVLLAVSLLGFGAIWRRRDRTDPDDDSATNPPLTDEERQLIDLTLARKDLP